ncbi:MAG TPA: aspartyl protease family protein [Steroidobacteraceae bacterium]|jgi:tetratricopeptide (TPR) repeat protein
MRFFFLASILTVAAVSPAGAENKCNLAQEAELPINMSGLRPLITAQVNGKDAQFLLDSGAFYSLMSTSTAEEHQLKLSVSPVVLSGVGGNARTWLTKVNNFAFLGAVFHDVEFLVSGSEVGSTGVIGQNLLSHFDVEYDLGKGVIRLFRPEGCAKTKLAYWVPANQAFSLMDINPADRFNPHTIGVAYINGQKIRAMFDTGAATSVLSLTAAGNMGINVNAPGVESAGYARGIGRSVAKSYIVRVASFKIGDDEEIKNTRIRVADIRLDEAEMLVGADFFLSHRVFVSNSQHKLYLTYNGGPVFNLANMKYSVPVPSAPAENESKDAEAATAATAVAGGAAADAPSDAAGYARLGAALASRHEFEQALKDFTKAIELNPQESDYLYRRAKLYRETGQAPLALADIDRVVALKPDLMEAYVSRAELHLAQKKFTEAVADLDVAAQLAPTQGDVRFNLAQLYAGSANFGNSIKQWDLWIGSHPVDSKFVTALTERCYMKALQNQDLSSALSDCNRAIPLANMRNPDNAVLLANRGMVRLRQGAYAKAISDFDDALKLQPKNVRALYGRGVAKIRFNKAPDGESDIEAAVKLSPTIKENLQPLGIGP